MKHLLNHKWSNNQFRTLQPWNVGLNLNRVRGLPEAVAFFSDHKLSVITNLKHFIIENVDFSSIGVRLSNWIFQLFLAIYCYNSYFYIPQLLFTFSSILPYISLILFLTFFPLLRQHLPTFSSTHFPYLFLSSSFFSSFSHFPSSFNVFIICHFLFFSLFYFSLSRNFSHS